jgi:hypothetical protein
VSAPLAGAASAACAAAEAVIAPPSVWRVVRSELLSRPLLVGAHGTAGPAQLVREGGNHFPEGLALRLSVPSHVRIQLDGIGLFGLPRRPCRPGELG